MSELTDNKIKEFRELYIAIKTDNDEVKLDAEQWLTQAFEAIEKKAKEDQLKTLIKYENDTGECFLYGFELKGETHK